MFAPRSEICHSFENIGGTAWSWSESSIFQQPPFILLLAFGEQLKIWASRASVFVALGTMAVLSSNSSHRFRFSLRVSE